MALAVVRDLRDLRDLRERRAPASPEEIAEFETDVLAGFVLARASAGLADATIRSDVGHLEQVRAWLGRPLWEMEPSDADAYFGKIIRGVASGTRLARTQALTTYFQFLELRHQVEVHQLTSRVLACPIDEMNRPRGAREAKLRVPPTEAEITSLFTGWREQLSGMDLISVQELLGHSWIATTMRYVHVHRSRIEDAWIAGQQRAAHRLQGGQP